MKTIEASGSENRSISPAKAWLRAIDLTADITDHPHRILPAVVEESAATWGDAPALLSDSGSLTYRTLCRSSNRYSRWALSQNLATGETVCLLMPNRPEYVAIWLGITRIGGVVALINTNLSGASLAHCINLVAPKHIIVAGELLDALEAALPDIVGAPVVWTHGMRGGSRPRIDDEIERHSEEGLDSSEARAVRIEDRALYIFTSGTTGLPKAVNVSHARIMQWSHWFAGMMDLRPVDRIYGCLPMYHSVGGVVAPGAMLAAGGSLVIREKFSASQFWSDVIRSECTLIQYIGELCRYLLQCSNENLSGHRVRMAFGNGLACDIWDEFRIRFGIPQIFEFYAATEGGVSLFNIEGERGAIGRVPSYLAHRFLPALVQFDLESGQPRRNESGFCIPCASGEVGEAIGKITNDSNIGSRFEGYTTESMSQRRLMRNVFEPGDKWVRTGDLMRKDNRGFFYFVDRVGDTFRWKGENVATSEVSEVICAFEGIRQANVYGVAIPGADGRAGMAALATDREIDLSIFRRHLSQRLPRYARPLFLRITNEMQTTGTFRHTKTQLVNQGYDPGSTDDLIYFDHPEHNAFVRLDQTLYDSIQARRIRL